MLAVFSAQFSLSPEEVQLAGTDWAFERGDYAITLTPKAGGDPIEDAGKYITLYQRQAGGRWLMARDIWNSNNPPPG
jgi:ketosteroid isomerase-like protein